MPDVNAWYGQAARITISAAARAQAAWQRIQDKPTSIVIRRGGAKLAAQTVRLEYANTPTEIESTNAQAYRRSVTLFGVVDHPTVANTDVRTGDEFGLDGEPYVVRDVMTTIGELQASCYRMER